MKKYVVMAQFGIEDEWDCSIMTDDKIKELVQADEYGDFLTGLVIYEPDGFRLKPVTIYDVREAYTGIW